MDLSCLIHYFRRYSAVELLKRSERYRDDVSPKYVREAITFLEHLREEERILGQEKLLRAEYSYPPKVANNRQRMSLLDTETESESDGREVALDIMIDKDAIDKAKDSQLVGTLFLMNIPAYLLKGKWQISYQFNYSNDLYTQSLLPSIVEITLGSSEYDIDIYTYTNLFFMKINSMRSKIRYDKTERKLYSATDKEPTRHLIALYAETSEETFLIVANSLNDKDIKSIEFWKLCSQE